MWWNWQTCGTQNPVVAIPCGFDPHHRHQTEWLNRKVFHHSVFLCLFFCQCKRKNFSNVFLTILSEQIFKHCSGWDFLLELQVSVNITRSCYWRMSEPFLYYLDIHSLRNKKCCTAVTRIVKPDMRKPIPFEKTAEFVWSGIRSNSAAILLRHTAFKHMRPMLFRAYRRGSHSLKIRIWPLL